MEGYASLSEALSNTKADGCLLDHPLGLHKL